MGKASRFENAAQRERHIVDMVNSAVRGCDHETIPIRKAWTESQNLFMGRQDWGAENEMSEWQSRSFLHEFAPIIRTAATEATNLIFQRPEFINLIPGDTANQEVGKIREKMIRYYLEKMKFVQKFPEWCISGCMFGIAIWKLSPVLCTYWEPGLLIDKIEAEFEKQTKGIKGVQRTKALLPESDETLDLMLQRDISRIFGGLNYRPPTIGPKKKLEMVPHLTLVNPFNFFWLPDARNINESPWMAERIFTKFFQNVPLFETNYYDRSKREELMKSKAPTSSGTISNYYSQKYSQRDQLTQTSTYFPDVEVIDYYGPLLDKDGDVLEENCHFVIGNGRILLRDSINMSWKQKAPFFSTTFNIIPFKPTGAGVADSAKPHQIMINNLWSLFLDSLTLDTYAPIAANYDMLMDPSQIEGGLKPGAVIGTFGGSARDVFSEVPRASNSSADMFQALEKLSLSAQKGSSVNTSSSNPASRARISSREIGSNDAAKFQTISSLGRDIDTQCIEELVTRTDDIVLQHGFTNDNLELLASKGILNEAEYQLIANMSPTSRFVESQGHFKMEVRGFRAAMERDQFLQRSSELISQVNQMPPRVQDKLQWDRVLRDLVDVFGFDANAWVRQNTPQDKAHEENALIVLNQFLQVAEDDDDAAHLPVHYQQLLEAGPVPAVVNHVMSHVQRMAQRGEPLPPPPPEVAEMLGLPPPNTPQQRGKSTSGGKQGPLGLPGPE